MSYFNVLVVLVSSLVVLVSAKSRIIGGTDAYAGQFPFAAAIRVRNYNSQYFCGGAIVHPKLILTTARCVHGGQLFVVQIGSNSLDVTDSSRVLVSTTTYRMHPLYIESTLKHDIGFVTLREDITYTEYIQPIMLATEGLLNYTQVTALGWGQTSDAASGLSSTLQYVNTAVLTNSECQRVYGDAVFENMVCVSGNYNQGTCLGDTGGPLIQYVDNSYQVVGVASFVSGNGCESTDPSGFTRVFPYVDWLQSMIDAA